MSAIAAAYGPGMPGRKAAALPRRLGAAVVLMVALAHAGAHAAAATAPTRILALGDSLAAGYGLPHEQAFEAQLEKSLRAKGENVRILDGAVSGDTTAGGRARLDWVLADHPDAAIIELGGNDGLRGIDPNQTEANLQAILDALQKRGIPVLLCGMYAPPNLGADYATSFRAAFDRLGKRAGIIYDPFFLQGVAADPALNQPDRIHPNAAGVQRIVARLLPLAERLIAEVRQP